MTAAALVVYGALLAAAVVAVFRRPVVALYVFVLGLPLHNLVMSLLYGGGVRGGALDVIQAWKEILLATTLLSVGLRAVHERRLPFRPHWVDALALAYAAVVLLYAQVRRRSRTAFGTTSYSSRRTFSAARSSRSSSAWER